MSDELLTICATELFYEVSPQISPDALCAELQKRCGNVDKIKTGEDAFLFRCWDFSSEFNDATIPAHIVLAHSSDGKSQTGLEDALQQSWAWQEAREAIGRSGHSLLLTDLMASGLTPKARLSVFHNALESVLALAPCAAIWWKAARHVVDPAVYAEARKSSGFHPLRFAVNVRLFNVSHRTLGELIMDTLGLGTLGLPDLQCHFRELDPNDIARVLYNSAYYLFDNGDIIQDGHTIQGLRSDDKWRCRHEAALAKPDRVVVDINPGSPYAAGNR
jgi:hypothetical protein